MIRVIRAAALAAVLAGCAGPAQAPPTVVFLSDFGATDDSVAICKGVMLQVEPRLRIVDLTHEVPPFSILDGARFLAGTAPHFPPGTVFVAVVDPGVGGERKAVVVRTRRGQTFVLPDNGLITLVADRDGVEEAREIVDRGFLRGSGRSSTFHGRDVFSPVAAHLARGEDWRKVGPVVDRWVRLEIAAARIDGGALFGEVIALDGPYGNLVTNVDAELFGRLGWVIGDRVPVQVGTAAITLPFVRTFSDVPEQQPLLYVDSRDRLALAINLGDFAKTHGVKPPVPLRVNLKSPSPGSPR